MCHIMQIPNYYTVYGYACEIKLICLIKLICHYHECVIAMFYVCINMLINFHASLILTRVGPDQNSSAHRLIGAALIISNIFDIYDLLPGSIHLYFLS